MGKHMLDGVAGFNKRTDMFYVDPREILVRDGWNPRTDFSGEEELMYSIIEEGVKTPLKVRRNQDRRMELVDGERRLRATLKAIAAGFEIESVPVIVNRAGANEIDLFLETMISNTGKPLSEVEEADGFRKLINYGLDVVTIAKKTGRSEQHVRNRLKLSDAIPPVKTAVIEKKIGVGTAIDIVKTSDGSVENQTQSLERELSRPRPKREPVIKFIVKEGKLVRKDGKPDNYNYITWLLNPAVYRKMEEQGYDMRSLEIIIKLKKENNS